MSSRPSSIPCSRGPTWPGRAGPARPRRAVIVTQTRIGQDTRPLEHDGPRLWAYLSAHAAAFARRKSSIYRGQPPFAMFGDRAVQLRAVQGGRLGSAQDAAVPRDRAGRGPAGHARRHLLFPRLPRRPSRRRSWPRSSNDGGGAGLPPLPDLPGAKRPITKAILQRLDLPRSPPAPTARHCSAAPTRSATGCSVPAAEHGRAVRLARGVREPGSELRPCHGSAKIRTRTPRWPSPRSTTTATRSTRRRRSTSSSPTTPTSPSLVGLLPAPRPVRRPHDLDAPDEHRAVRRWAAAGGRHARRRPGLVHQRRRRAYAYEDDLIKDVIGLVEHDLPGQGRALRPGDRRALDGGLRRGQARA